jgi:preprotein translocase subunit SecD
MKTIFSIIYIGVLCLIMAFSAQQMATSLTLHPSAGNATTMQLSESAEIISARLKTMNFKATVSVNNDNKTIEVKVTEKTSGASPEGVLTSKGNIGFYELLTPSELATRLNEPLHKTPDNGSLICTAEPDKHISDSIEKVLQTANLSSEYKLLWGNKNRESKRCLFAVRKTPVLSKPDIENVKSTESNNGNSPVLQMLFKPDAAKIWAEATKRNLNKPVAIVIDDIVYADPVVRTVIEGGLCELSGDYGMDEINYFLALISNASLPLKLELK